MRGVMVSNGFLSDAKFGEPFTMMSAAAERHGIDLESFSNTDLCTPLGDMAAMSETVGDADFIIFWDKDVRCARNMEICGYHVFNSSECIRLCDDKSLTHLKMLEHSVPTIRTVSCPLTFDGIGYGDKTFLDSVECLGYPMVVKDCFGSFGQQVHLVRDRKGLESLLTDARPMIFQEYVECGNSDLRLEVVGGRVVAAVSRKSTDGDFRANATLGGKMSMHEPTCEETELAVRACEAVGADFAGVDILYREGEPLVCEVNSNAHIKNMRDCTGTDVSDAILEHILDSL